jgi:hypothetical protein
MARWAGPLILCFAWTIFITAPAQAQELSNDSLRLQLNVTGEGIPVIEQADWKATGRMAFRDLGTPDGLTAWISETLIPESPNVTPEWNVTEGAEIIAAEATRDLTNGMRLTWVVELPKHGQLLRLYVRLTNAGRKASPVDWFPAWSACWDVGGGSQWVRWWKSIEYKGVEMALDPGARVRLGSELYSSDDGDGGDNPYWIVGGSDGRVYFGLQWCGGWSAKLQRLDEGFSFAVRLPSEETQLVLGAGETIEGPALLVMPVPDSDDAHGRAFWMKQRRALGQTLYGSPATSFPLIYNHWYAARQDVDASFLNRQIAAVSPYSFDAFVVDAGWFTDGRWKPDPAKFQPGEFEQLLASLKENGIKPGLWTTPQYVSTVNDTPDLTMEQPPVFSKYIGGYLIDLSQEDFPNYLTEHVQMLRDRYSVDYWKYDQPFFTEQSRAGKMKDVVGFQKGIQSVRSADRDLFIENCLNGGRMINEFTLLATQTTWLADLGNSGIPDPRENILIALGALEFVFPWAALRFTINIDRINQDDDETLKLNCRSAMAGTWGISSDLSLVSEHQRNVVLKEISNYRRLNRLKDSCLYDLQLPNDDSNVAGVTFYGRRPVNAGILLYRWHRDGSFDQRVILPQLDSRLTYRVVDVDMGTEATVGGSELVNDGVSVSFASERLSAVLFVDPVPKPHTR